MEERRGGVADCGGHYRRRRGALLQLRGHRDVRLLRRQTTVTVVVVVAVVPVVVIIVRGTVAGSGRRRAQSSPVQFDSIARVQNVLRLQNLRLRRPPTRGPGE